MKKWVCICLCLFFLNSAVAQSKNLVHLKLFSKKIALEMDAVATVSKDSFTLVALDDFGGQPFLLEFVNDQMFFVRAGQAYTLKKGSGALLQMPLSKGDLMSFLKFKKPLGFEAVSKLVWRSQKHPKLKVEFSPQSFKVDQRRVPRSFRIEYQDHDFEWQWKQ